MDDSKMHVDYNDSTNNSSASPIYPNIAGNRFEMMKELISHNREFSKWVLKSHEKPITYISISFSKLNTNGFSTIRVFRDIEHYFWVDLALKINKKLGPLHATYPRYVVDFKDLKFSSNGNELIIKFRTKLLIYEQELN